MVTIKFQSESPIFDEGLEVNLVRFLAHDFIDGLANKGLFALTRHPSLTPAVSLSLGETTEEPGCTQVKRPKFGQILAFSPEYNLVPR